MQIIKVVVLISLGMAVPWMQMTETASSVSDWIQLQMGIFGDIKAVKVEYNEFLGECSSKDDRTVDLR